jgi:hypothetical protein
LLSTATALPPRHRQAVASKLLPSCRRRRATTKLPPPSCCTLISYAWNK